MAKPKFWIEARSLSIGPASHNYLVLCTSNDKGQTVRLAELHGMAYNNKTKQFATIGYNSNHRLSGLHIVHDRKFDQEIPSSLKDISAVSKAKGLIAPYKGPDYRRTYVHENQTRAVLITGTEQDIKARWLKGVEAANMLTEKNLPYPAGGFKLFKTPINSNSAYATYSEIMNLRVHNFPGVAEPGLKGRFLTPEEIDKFKYQPGKQETRQAAPSGNKTTSLEPGVKYGRPTVVDGMARFSIKKPDFTCFSMESTGF